MAIRPLGIVSMSLMLLMVAAIGADAEGDKYPARQIQLIVPFVAGGALDVATRIIEPKLSAALGAPVVIVARPGASGVLGVRSVVNAPPDGYTVAATFNTTINLVRLNSKDVGYTYKDLTAVGNYAVDVGAIVADEQARWKTLSALLDEAAHNPGKLSYGSAGVGSVSSIILEAIKFERGLNMVNVPFQGSPPVNFAVVGKQVDFGSVAFSAAIPMVRDNKLRVLGVSAPKRLASFPDIPTLSEQGIRNANLSLKAGFYLPAATPKHIVDTFAKAFEAAMQDPTIAPTLERAGLFLQYENAAAAQDALAKEYDDVMELGRTLKLPR